MSIFSGIVLYAVIWFLVLFIILPLRLQTQGEAGEIVQGTHASAPANPQMRKRALITTAVAAVLWVIITAIILAGIIRIEDLDFLGRFGT
jgi:predicted secreted protein